MKAIITSIIILLSFSNLSAQEVVSSEESIVEVKKNTKVDFFETLIAVNNFDIKIKKTEKLAIKTKSDFYKALMIKNGFSTDDKENSRLVDNDRKEKDSMMTDTTQITGL
ncbi:hypothetical protein [Aquimarina sp. MMG016]|uniref:hypothetical protein n=1 Tax=Aquimarina sp. MMG016 TaxID=2822690 RepID=UPI001B39D962|nr:hypothetical protein [Aquimarina sp. MMG016]MBQ4820464.1 hypothetical protein [Aquimarina sp. MMG016]